MITLQVPRNIPINSRQIRNTKNLTFNYQFLDVKSTPESFIEKELYPLETDQTGKLLRSILAHPVRPPLLNDQDLDHQ